DARLDCDQVDTDQGDSHPGIDHDALVEHAVEHVDQAGRTGRSLYGHRLLLASLGLLIVARDGRGKAWRPGPRADGPSAAVVQFRTTPVSPETGNGRTATNPDRSAAPCRASTRSGGCGW